MSTLSDLTKERKKYKELIENKWCEFSESDDFKSIINELSLNNYKFQIAKIAQKHEILNLVNDAYNKKTWFAKLFGNVTQSTNIINSIKNGRCFIVIEKTTDEIVGCTIIDDILDDKNVDHVDDDDDSNKHERVHYNASDTNKHLIEVATADSQKVYDFVLNKVGDETKLKYGLCIHGGSWCTKYNINNTGFSLIYSLISRHFFGKYIGYKMAVGEAAHIKTINIAKAMGGHIIYESDYSSHIFEDGTNINVYFNKLKLKNANIDIEQFKKQCKSAAVFGEFSMQKYSINRFKKWAKMVKQKIDKRSKL